MHIPLASYMLIQMYSFFAWVSHVFATIAVAILDYSPGLCSGVGWLARSPARLFHPDRPETCEHKRNLQK